MDKEKSKLSKLTLGTVQLGMPYGIANRSGMPDEAIAQDILEEAWRNGITSFDTAAAYGESEKRIGAFVEKHPERIPFLFIATKGTLKPPSALTEEALKRALFEQLETSKAALRLPTVPLYMAHRYEDLRHYAKAYTAFFRQAKEQGRIRWAGVSLYSPEEAEEILNPQRDTPPLDVLQIPLNLFDRRFLENRLIERLRESGFMIFTRSVFLQGLFFLPVDSVPDKTREATPFLKQLNALSTKYGIGIREMAIGYVRRRADPDSILVGVESVAQLRENLEAFEHAFPEELNRKIDRTFIDVPPSIYDPRRW
ncbi:MAG TPA: aldo/keto reductase [Thermotogota bacterium]|nr:aldo/keto reductase [Thermotogota bacterium]HQN22628.1 aldo/keto reductase [Thermotogota bacterium]